MQSRQSLHPLPADLVYLLMRMLMTVSLSALALSHSHPLTHYAHNRDCELVSMHTVASMLALMTACLIAFDRSRPRYVLYSGLLEQVFRGVWLCGAGGPQHVNDFDPLNPTAWMQGHNYVGAPAPQMQQSSNPLSPGHAEPPMKVDCECKMQCTYMMAKTQKNNGRWFYR